MRRREAAHAKSEHEEISMSEFPAEELIEGRRVFQNRFGGWLALEVGLGGCYVGQIAEHLQRSLFEHNTTQDTGFIYRLVATGLATVIAVRQAAEYRGVIRVIDDELQQREAAQTQNDERQYPFVPLEGDPVDPNMYDPVQAQQWLM